MSQEGSNVKVFIFATFVIVTGLVALRVLFFPRDGAVPRKTALPPVSAAAPDMARTSGVFSGARESERLQAELAGRDLAVPKADTLPRLELPAAPPRDPAVDRMIPPGGQRSAAKPGPAPAQSGPSRELSEQEKALLESVGGPTSQEEALKFGGSFDLMAKVMLKVSKYPRVAEYLLNNDWVVKGFMSRPTTRQTCSDPGKLKAFFMDTASPNGIRRSLPIARQVAHGSREMPAIIAGSKLVTEYISCPSFNAFLTDQAAVQEAAIANPAVLSAMTEPEIMQGILSSPKAMGAFTKVQSAGVFGSPGNKP